MMPTTLLFTVLAGVCMADNSSLNIDNEDTRKLTETVTMFPDGTLHDFGRVQRGIDARFTFRVVNTSRVPLKIIALRWPSGALNGRVTKPVLRPGEVGKVEVRFETARFRGPKTAWLLLEIDNGKRMAIEFTIKADSQEGPVP